ncbi:MAG TPA: heavy metal-binding domain-containing protein, partial [Gemmatimonadales bacterium]|nr:heavy metal-binding domain-containing protein [Gemmatimonadales bacterium]
MNHDLTTTAPMLDGYQVIHNLGIVRGISVRSRSVFGTIGARIETLFGGNIALLTT